MRRLLVMLLVLVAAVAASAAFYSETVQVDQWGAQITFESAARDVTFTNVGGSDAYVKIWTFCDEVVWITPYVGSGRFRVRPGAVVGVTFSPQTECGKGYGYKGFSATSRAEDGATSLEVMAK